MKRIRLDRARGAARSALVTMRHHAQQRNGDLVAQLAGAVEDRAQLAARKRRRTSPAPSATDEGQRQQQQAVRRHRLGRHARRVDQPEVGHARGHFELARHRRRLATSDQVFVVLLVDGVVAIQLRGFGLELRRGLQRLARAVVAGRVLGHTGAQRRPPAPRTWPACGSVPGRPDCRAPPGAPAGAAMAALRSSCTSLRFCSSRSLISAPRADDVGVLVGEALQQRVEVALLRVDAGIDLGRGDADMADSCSRLCVARLRALRLFGCRAAAGPHRAPARPRAAPAGPGSSCSASSPRREAESLPSAVCNSMLRSRNSFSRVSASSSLAS